MKEGLTSNINTNKSNKDKIQAPKIIKKKSFNSVSPLFYKNLEYYPLMRDSTLSKTMQIIWIIIYIIIWGALIGITYNKRFLNAYILGFSIGLSILLLEYFYKNLSQLLVINNKDENAYELLLNKSNETMKDIDNSDWLIYPTTKFLPASTQKGYFLETDYLNDLQLNNNMNVIPINSMYNGLFQETVNIGSQSLVRFFSQYNSLLGQNCFYIIILILAWSMYLIKTRWFKLQDIYWVLLAISVALISGVIMNNATTIYNANYLYEIKKKFLVLAISIAGASILIN